MGEEKMGGNHACIKGISFEYYQVVINRFFMNYSLITTSC
jgi:hypothetical protein